MIDSDLVRVDRYFDVRFSLKCPQKKKIVKDVIPMSCVTLKVVALRLIPANLASGARLAEENEGQAVGEKTFILTG